MRAWTSGHQEPFAVLFEEKGVQASFANQINGDFMQQDGKTRTQKKVSPNGNEHAKYNVP